MRQAADAALSRGGDGDSLGGATEVPEYVAAVTQCAAERRALLDAALRALGGESAAPPGDL